MVLGRDTFAGDLLQGLGVDNVFAESRSVIRRSTRTPYRSYDLVVLPDEPYAFSPADGPEAFERPSGVYPDGI